MVIKKINKSSVIPKSATNAQIVDACILFLVDTVLKVPCFPFHVAGET